jgi:hypothetical protein
MTTYIAFVLLIARKGAEAGCKLKPPATAGSLLGLIFSPEDGGNVFHQNIRHFLNYNPEDCTLHQDILILYQMNSFLSFTLHRQTVH